MYILVKVDGESLKKLITYLGKNKIWHKLFPEKVYNVEVTAEDRVDKIRQSGRGGQLNPNMAWNSCASFVQIWDWDTGGRGPWPSHGDPFPKTPPGKGWVTLETGQKRRVAGECGNPTSLSHISCPHWCQMYQPTTIEGHVYIAEQTAEVHEQRAKELRRQVELLKTTEAQYEEVIRTGKVWRYQDGKFIITEP